MDLVLTKEVVKNLLVREDFYHKVPEFYYLKEAGSKIVSALDDKGGCSSCADRNLIQPTIQAFISNVVNMRIDCGPDSTVNLKKYVNQLYNQEVIIKVFFKETEDSETVEFEL